MYAPNSALLNALAHHKINFQQVLKFIDTRYDYEPMPFQNGSVHNAAGENQGSCKVFCFAHLNNFNPLDTLALFAEHYQAVKDNPEGNDHQNIRQFIHHGWAGIHFEGHALTPKANIDEINARAAQLYADGGSEFEEIPDDQITSHEPVDAQPGAQPLVNEPSDKLSENMHNFTPPAAPKDANGSVDEQSGSVAADPVSSKLVVTEPLVTEQDEQAAQAAVIETAVAEAHDNPHTSHDVPESQDGKNQLPADEAAPIQPMVNSQAAETAPLENDTLDEKTIEKLEEKAEQAIAAAQQAQQHSAIPPAPGSSSNMATETTYYTDNDSVADEAVSEEKLTTSGVTNSSLANEPASPAIENNAIQDDAPQVDVTQDDTQQQQAAQAASANDDTGTRATGNMSAAALTMANHAPPADNPAAFIDDSDTSAPDEPATTPEQAGSSDATSLTPLASTDTAQNTGSANIDSVNTVATSNKPEHDSSASPATTANTAPNPSGLAAVGAAEIVQGNTQHIADNPAEFIDEQHSSSAPDQPATTAGTNTPGKPAQ